MREFALKFCENLIDEKFKRKKIRIINARRLAVIAKENSTNTIFVTLGFIVK